jgi:hypothetical protein
MFAGKQFDIVMGTDIHLIQPPGPVPPVPIPHPFIGMVFDPPEFIPTVGTILVNGLPRAQAGSNVKCMPPHIPIGGTFVKPPGNDGEVQMGGKSIKAETDPFTYFGAPVLTCQDAGNTSVSRAKRHSKCKPKSLLLPTSFLLPVPKGGIVALETGIFQQVAAAAATFGRAAAAVAPIIRAGLVGAEVGGELGAGAGAVGGAGIGAVPGAVIGVVVGAVIGIGIGLVVMNQAKEDEKEEEKPQGDKEKGIEIDEKDKIDRDRLNPPEKKGNAPTFKEDGTPVEIHHEGQSKDGPFKEMHWEDHRGKGNDSVNHPDKGQPSEIDRKEFNKAKREYWKKEYPNVK